MGHRFTVLWSKLMKATGKFKCLEQAPSIRAIEVKAGEKYESIRDKLGKQRIAAKAQSTFDCKILLSDGLEFTLKNINDQETGDRAKALKLATDFVAGSLAEFGKQLQHENNGSRVISKNYYSLYCRMQAIRYGNDKTEFDSGFDKFQKNADLAMKSGDVVGYEEALKELGAFIAEKASDVNDLDALLAELDNTGIKRSEDAFGLEEGGMIYAENLSNESSVSEEAELPHVEDSWGRSEDSEADTEDPSSAKMVHAKVKPEVAGAVNKDSRHRELMQELDGKFEGQQRKERKEYKNVITKPKKRNTNSQTRNRQIGTRTELHLDGSGSDAAMNKISRKQEKSRRVMVQGTANSIEHVIHEKVSDAGRKISHSALRDRYCEPLDEQAPELQTAGRRRKDFGRDATNWWALVDREICQDPIDVQLLHNMCRLLAADCEGVFRLSAAHSKRKDLLEMKQYFKQQAAVFLPKEKPEVDDGLKTAAVAFSLQCKIHTPRIVEYSNYKPSQEN
jgi:hypothetical protein